MRAFFAVGDGRTAARMLTGRNVLLSFAYLGTSWLPAKCVSAITSGALSVMVDSGAFTAWKQGKAIDLEDYLRWLEAPAFTFETAIALDVIGDADASVSNWQRMRARAPHVRLMPVWHEGDPIEHLDEYAARAPIVGLGRIEGRRSEVKTLEFYDAAFNRWPTLAMHALGNANPTTLEPYPFASFDSTGWQRDAAYSNAARWPFNRCSRETRMRAYLEATETVEHRPAKQMRLFGGAA
jgi:hypothetical protein